MSFGWWLELEKDMYALNGNSTLIKNLNQILISRNNYFKTLCTHKTDKK